jgi:hypothetical protein
MKASVSQRKTESLPAKKSLSRTLTSVLYESSQLFQKFQRLIHSLPFVCVGIRSFCKSSNFRGEPTWGEETIVRAQVTSWPLIRKLSAKWKGGVIRTSIVGWVGVVLEIPFSCTLSTDTLVRWRKGVDARRHFSLERHYHKHEPVGSAKLSPSLRTCLVQVSAAYFQLRNVGSQNTLTTIYRLAAEEENAAWSYFTDNGLQFRLLEQDTKLYLDLKSRFLTFSSLIYPKPLWSLVCSYLVLGDAMPRGT